MNHKLLIGTQPCRRRCSQTYEYPLVSIIYLINPRCPKRPEIVSAMKDLSSKYKGWESEDLDDSTKWGNIYYDKSLLEFLPQEDHIDAIQQFFIERLKELHEIKKQHPEFGWK